MKTKNIYIVFVYKKSTCICHAFFLSDVRLQTISLLSDFFFLQILIRAICTLPHTLRITVYDLHSIFSKNTNLFIIWVFLFPSVCILQAQNRQFCLFSFSNAAKKEENENVRLKRRMQWTKNILQCFSFSFFYLEIVRYPIEENTIWLFGYFAKFLYDLYRVGTKMCRFKFAYLLGVRR